MEGRAPDLKQQDLYHLESNLCQLCLQVKLSNLTARVSTWGCGHVQGGVARLGVRTCDALGVCGQSCIRVRVCVRAMGTMVRCRCRFLLSKCRLCTRPDGTTLSTVSLSLKTANGRKKQKKVLFI